MFTRIIGRIVLFAFIAALFVQTTTNVQANEESNGLGRGHLYSQAALNAFCTGAQMVIAQTSLVSENVVHDTQESFIGSDATPYETPEGETLPLTSQQYVSYATYPNKPNKSYPQVVSCKMKSAAALEYFYGADAAEAGNSCRNVHELTVDAVYASLTRHEERELVFTRDEVVLAADVNARSGPDWLTPFPPDVASTDADGNLVLQAKALPVPRFLPPFLPVPPEKRGVHYCHVASPHYILALVTGEVAP